MDNEKFLVIPEMVTRIYLSRFLLSIAHEIESGGFIIIILEMVVDICALISKSKLYNFNHIYTKFASIKYDFPFHCTCHISYNVRVTYPGNPGLFTSHNTPNNNMHFRNDSATMYSWIAPLFPREAESISNWCFNVVQLLSVVYFVILLSAMLFCCFVLLLDNCR